MSDMKEKTMDFEEFKKKYGTEEQCRNYLANLRWKDGFCCPKCQYDRAWKTSEFKFKCQRCGCKTSVTAGTLFQDTHFPLTIWFHAMWHVTSTDRNITIKKIQEELKICNYRPAWLLLNKIRWALWNCHQSEDNYYPDVILFDKLKGLVEIIEWYVIFKNKRTNVAIAVEIRENNVGFIRDKNIGDLDYKKMNEFLEESVEKGTKLRNGIGNNYAKRIPKGYQQQENLSYLYRFPYAYKTLKEIQSFLSNSMTQSVEKGLEEYCNHRNTVYYKKINPKPTHRVTFEELVQTAVELPPKSNTW